MSWAELGFYVSLGMVVFVMGCAFSGSGRGIMGYICVRCYRTRHFPLRVYLDIWAISRLG